jgi:hypothetical protein
VKAAVPAFNPLWHLVHPMPRHANVHQRLAWHRAHERNCGCRPMPPRLASLAKREQHARRTHRQ